MRLFITILLQNIIYLDVFYTVNQTKRKDKE